MNSIYTNPHVIYFDDDFDEDLTDEHINKLKELTEKGHTELMLPKGGYCFDIERLAELDKLEILYLVNYHRDIVKLPPNLKIIDLGNGFNNRITFPDSIETIKIGFNFNQKIEKYPKNLKHIDFGKKFNQR